MEKIIKHHVAKDNNIIIGGWGGAYQWMNNIHSGYNRIIQIHENHDFGHGEESTSHIESVWSNLKCLLSKFYVSVKSENFIYFVKECKWMKKYANLDSSQKLAELQYIFIHISNIVEFK